MYRTNDLEGKGINNNPPFTIIRLAITETADEISGRTWMDNFPMWHYLIDLGIPADVIHYEEY